MQTMTNASDSDTDIEYEKLREKLDSFLENNCSDEDDYEEDEQPYLADISTDIPENVSDDNELLELGTIHSVVDGIAIVTAGHGVPVLDLGTVVVLPDRTSIGVIGDTFGPVDAPFYSIKIIPQSLNKVVENLPVLFCPSLSRQVSRNDLQSSESESE